jgi:hypothetical protein
MQPLERSPASWGPASTLDSSPWWEQVSRSIWCVVERGFSCLHVIAGCQKAQLHPLWWCHHLAVLTRVGPGKDLGQHSLVGTGGHDGSRRGGCLPVCFFSRVGTPVVPRARPIRTAQCQAFRSVTTTARTVAPTCYALPTAWRAHLSPLDVLANA